MATIPNIQDPHFENLCRIVANAITGSDIDRYLGEVGASSTLSSDTKWKHLYQDLGAKQSSDRCGNNVFNFIQKACHPSRFIQNPEKFNSFLSELNKVLCFIGYNYTEKGEFKGTQKSATISEARERYSTLMGEMERRRMHLLLHKFCREELLQENYFHAVLEATKSINQRIRDLTGLTSDGEDLYNKAFSFKFTTTENYRPPILALSSLTTESEQSEQKGFMQLVKGVSQTFRNPVAHSPKVLWGVDKEDAIDIFTTISLIHRKLDKVTVVHSSK